MFPPFQPERVHNHRKKLYCKDSCLNPLMNFQLYSNIQHEPNLQKTAVKLMRIALENGSKKILR